MTIYRKQQGNLRRKLLALYFEANAGHIGSSLSCIDLLIALFQVKRKSERVILSKGHAAAAMYVMLHSIGEIPGEELETFYKNGTKLPAHPAANVFENIPFGLGSLGHGLPIGCGMATANHLQGNNELVFVLMSDGETNEGTTWEAAHFAVANKLDNLVLVIDKNNLQGIGRIQDVLGDTADAEKWKVIGFNVIETDGHQVIDLISHLDSCRKANQKPTLLIANTIKGKGVDYMEDQMEWHYLPMNEALYKQALESLRKNYYA